MSGPVLAEVVRRRTGAAARGDGLPVGGDVTGGRAVDEVHGIRRRREARPVDGVGGDGDGTARGHHAVIPPDENVPGLGHGVKRDPGAVVERLVAVRPDGTVARRRRAGADDVRLETPLGEEGLKVVSGDGGAVLDQATAGGLRVPAEEIVMLAHGRRQGEGLVDAGGDGRRRDRAAAGVEVKNHVPLLPDGIETEGTVRHDAEIDSRHRLADGEFGRPVGSPRPPREVIAGPRPGAGRQRDGVRGEVFGRKVAMGVAGTVVEIVDKVVGDPFEARNQEQVLVPVAELADAGADQRHRFPRVGRRRHADVLQQRGRQRPDRGVRLDVDNPLHEVLSLRTADERIGVRRLGTALDEFRRLGHAVGAVGDDAERAVRVAVLLEDRPRVRSAVEPGRERADPRSSERRIQGQHCESEKLSHITCS